MDSLKTMREALGLTQAELAEKVGTSQPQIRRLESGERELTRAWAERLAPHLKTTAIHIVFPDVPLPADAGAKIKGETAIKNLFRRIDNLPETAIEPLWGLLTFYLPKDVGQSEYSRDHDQSAQPNLHHGSGPSDKRSRQPASSRS